uniref:Uncharacterized protein n=1 Tax=Arion vulgaris TaxID=1028688 RepID=A0A0B6ZM01_9EUPU
MTYIVHLCLHCPSLPMPTLSIYAYTVFLQIYLISASLHSRANCMTVLVMVSESHVST